MKRLRYIWMLLGMLSLAGNIFAQSGPIGSVTLHADPRLSILTRKQHDMEQVTASSVTVKHKTAKAVTHSEGLSNIPQPMLKNSKSAATVPPQLPQKNIKVASYAAVNMKTDAVVKPLPNENGHAAGWTPPVHHKLRTIYSGKGFRVQIYNGPDRGRALAIKTEFMRMYPGIRTYLTYMAPSFRVKVGDYRNRSDAVGMLKEANSIYNPSMIVPDVITISTF